MNRRMAVQAKMPMCTGRRRRRERWSDGEREIQIERDGEMERALGSNTNKIHPLFICLIVCMS